MGQVNNCQFGNFSLSSHQYNPQQKGPNCRSLGIGRNCTSTSAFFSHLLGGTDAVGRIILVWAGSGIFGVRGRLFCLRWVLIVRSTGIAGIARFVPDSCELVRAHIGRISQWPLIAISVDVDTGNGLTRIDGVRSRSQPMVTCTWIEKIRWCGHHIVLF